MAKPCDNEDSDIQVSPFEVRCGRLAEKDLRRSMIPHCWNLWLKLEDLHELGFLEQVHQ